MRIVRGLGECVVAGVVAFAVAGKLYDMSALEWEEAVALILEVVFLGSLIAGHRRLAWAVGGGFFAMALAYVALFARSDCRCFGALGIVGWRWRAMFLGVAGALAWWNVRVHAAAAGSAGKG